MMLFVNLEEIIHGFVLSCVDYCGFDKSSPSHLQAALNADTRELTHFNKGSLYLCSTLQVSF